MTIQDLLVRDGRWPDVKGSQRNVTNEAVIKITTDHIPKNKWYSYDNKHGSLRMKVQLFMPTDAKMGDHMYVGKNMQIIKRGDEFSEHGEKAIGKWGWRADIPGRDDTPWLCVGCLK